MKKLSILLTALLVISILSSCSSSNYQLIEKDGNYYIRLGDTVSGPASNSENLTLEYPPIRFDTVAEMKSDIQTGNFTEEELRTLNAKFERNEDGLIQVCNISKLYEPTYPAAFDDYTVVMFCDGYNFEINSTKSSTNAVLYFKTKNETDSQIQRYANYDSNFNDESGSVLHSKVVDHESGRTTYEYTTKWGIRVKLAFYSLEILSKNMFIVETYLIDESTAKPSLYEIYASENGHYYLIQITGMTKELTLDELSQFGIREYVETVTE